MTKTNKRKGYDQSPDYGGRKIGRIGLALSILIPVIVVLLLAAGLIKAGL